MIKIETQRMIIYPLPDEDMQMKINNESNEEMKNAYSEMLEGCKKDPKQRIWNAMWVMQKKNDDKQIIGDLCFRGFNNGIVEIGYGIQQEYEGQGFMTEAVRAIVKWASKQPGVIRIEAETDSNNIASQKVLKKSGFIANGVMGEEGPRFRWKGM